MKTLYVTDLDGTLMRDDLTLSEFSRRELTAMLDEGVAITLATARSMVSLSTVLGKMPFRLPVITSNGAYVMDYATKRREIVRMIDPKIAPGILSTIREFGIPPFLSTHHGSDELLFYEGVVNEGMQAYVNERTTYADKRLRKESNLDSRLSQSVVCFTVIDRESRLAELREKLESTFPGLLACTIYEYRYFPGWHFFTVHDRRATKAEGIKAIQEGWGLSDAELVVFGDDVNDIPMFRAASRAVAVANAREELKGLAHEVIGSNQEDSVVRYILGRLGKIGA